MSPGSRGSYGSSGYTALEQASSINSADLLSLMGESSPEADLLTADGPAPATPLELDEPERGSVHTEGSRTPRPTSINATDLLAEGQQPPRQKSRRVAKMLVRAGLRCQCCFRLQHECERRKWSALCASNIRHASLTPHAHPNLPLRTADGHLAHQGSRTATWWPGAEMLCYSTGPLVGRKSASAAHRSRRPTYLTVTLHQSRSPGTNGVASHLPIPCVHSQPCTTGTQRKPSLGAYPRHRLHEHPWWEAPSKTRSHMEVYVEAHDTKRAKISKVDPDRDELITTPKAYRVAGLVVSTPSEAFARLVVEALRHL